MRAMNSRTAVSRAAQVTLSILALIGLQGSAIGQASDCDASGPEVPAEGATRCELLGASCDDCRCDSQSARADEEAGTSLATIDELVAVGAPFAMNTVPEASGAIFGYRIDHTQPLAEILECDVVYGDEASDPAGADDEFGASVSCEVRDRIVVGSPGWDDDVNLKTNAGRIFAYKDTLPFLNLTFEGTLELLAGDVYTDAELGRSVDIAGQYVIGGAVKKAFVWFVTLTSASYDTLDLSDLPAAEAANLVDFGFSVAIWSNWAFVGDPDADNGVFQDRGAVHVFNRAGSANVWTYFETLKRPTGSPALGDDFGYSVDVSAGVLMVGAPGVDTTTDTDVGAVYAYSLSGTWVFRQELTGSDSDQDDRFGSAVSLTARLVGRALIGAPGRQGVGAGATDNVGKAYQFNFFAPPAIWCQVCEYTADDASASAGSGTPEHFGSAVAILDQVVVGMPGHNHDDSVTLFEDSGGAYIRERSDEDTTCP